MRLLVRCECHQNDSGHGFAPLESPIINCGDSKNNINIPFNKKGFSATLF